MTLAPNGLPPHKRRRHQTIRWTSAWAAACVEKWVAVCHEQVSRSYQNFQHLHKASILTRSLSCYSGFCCPAFHARQVTKHSGGRPVIAFRLLLVQR